MIQVDESHLNHVDRLGLAYCRLNSSEWDDILGPKPDGFDKMPDYPAPWWKFWRRPQISKHDIFIHRMRNIESMIGRANTSRCWWIFELGRTEDEWKSWYINKR